MNDYLRNALIAGCQITPWPRVTCVSEIDRPHFCTSGQPPGVQLFVNMLEATKEVPPEIIRAVREYRCCQLPLLSLAGLYPDRFLVLHEQSPALTMAVANNLWLNPRPFPAIHTVQRGIWGIVGGEASRSFARNMARIPADLVDPNLITVIHVRWVNSSNFRRIFRHAPRINKSVLLCFQLLHQNELYSNFISIAAEDEKMGRDVFAWLEMLIFNYHLIYPLTSLPYRNIKSFESLKKAYGRLEERFVLGEKYGANENQVVTYPCVLKETLTVKRVSNSYKLWDLANRMQNCSFRYHERIRARLAAVFTVPSRDLTILVEKVSSRWKLTTMERPHGCGPSTSDWAAISDWKKENNL